MTSEAPAWLAVLHGVCAWSSALLLGWSAAARLRARGVERGPVAATVGAALLGLAAATGFLLEPAFLHGLRQRVFLRSASLGWLFERKQHLSAGALFLAVSAVAIVHASRRMPVRLDPSIERRALLVAAALALAASLAGTLVALRVRG